MASPKPGAPCDDNDLCTLNDICGEGSCRDCGFLDDDADNCNGAWVCQAGACVAKPAVVCGTIGAGGCCCVANECNPLNGQCVFGSRHHRCADEEECTEHVCEGDGTCSHGYRAGCGEQHPCFMSAKPGATDPAVTECVCAIDSGC